MVAKLGELSSSVSIYGGSKDGYWLSAVGQG